MYAGEFHRWTYKSAGRNKHLKRPVSEWLIAKSPTIVSKEDFLCAQEALKARKALAKRNAKREYLLSGLLYCASCGCKMVGECYAPSLRHRRKQEVRYYVCWNGRRKILDKNCPTRSVRTETIEEAVWEEIRRLLKTPALLRRAILQSETLSSAGSHETLETLTKLLESKDAEEERLLDLYQIGTVDPEKLQRRVENLRKEQAVIRQNIEALKKRTQFEIRLKTLQELTKELKADIDAFAYEQKRRVLKLLLWGQPGLGVFLTPDHDVEIRGLIDFAQFGAAGSGGIVDHGGLVGIENTTSYVMILIPH